MATTRYIEDFADGLSGWGNWGLSGTVSASLAWNAGPPTSARWSIASSSGSGEMIMGYDTGVGEFAEGETVSLTAEVDSDGVTGSGYLRLRPATSGGTGIGSVLIGPTTALTGEPQTLTFNDILLPANTARLYIYSTCFLSTAHASPATFDTLSYLVTSPVTARIFPALGPKEKAKRLAILHSGGWI